MTLEDLGGPQAAGSSLVITSIVSGQHLLAAPGEAEKLSRISSSEWVEASRIGELDLLPERLEIFTRTGIVHDDSATGEQRLWLDREELLEASHWPPCAATFHLLNHYQESSNSPFGQVIDVSLQEREATERAARFIDAHGPPPGEFYVSAAIEAIDDLPLEIAPKPLVETLLKRRTCRHFRPKESIALHDLSQLLRVSLGPWGIRRLGSQTNLLLKTSPSGGSLHPIEGFPILFRCDGKKSGVYHYRADRHALALLKEIAEEELRPLAVHLAQGQDFVGTCSFLVVLVARFDRNFWKYRERENSYAVVLQDVGHLSQSFQLVATEAGLGAFYTGAINSEALTELLGLRYPAEAPIGILGFGVAEPDSERPSSIEAFHPERPGP